MKIRWSENKVYVVLIQEDGIPQIAPRERAIKLLARELEKEADVKAKPANDTSTSITVAVL